MKAETKNIIINGIETNYSISTDGVVTNTKTGKILKQTTNLGYKLVQLGVSPATCHFFANL